MKLRSGCPVSIALERFGDRWSLLIIRDMMVRGHRYYKDFLESGEGIASNVLADRLKRLRAAGIVTARADQADARRLEYRLTEKGIELAPVVLELLLWSARYEETGAPSGVMEEMAAHRGEVLREVRRRWEAGDPTPILPAFPRSEGERKKTARRVEIP